MSCRDFLHYSNFNAFISRQKVDEGVPPPATEENAAGEEDKEKVEGGEVSND